jgi:hypothetical protein
MQELLGGQTAGCCTPMAVVGAVHPLSTQEHHTGRLADAGGVLLGAAMTAAAVQMRLGGAVAVEVKEAGLRGGGLGEGGVGSPAIAAAAGGAWEGAGGLSPAAGAQQEPLK